jgi:adenosylhomocysteine nucleosidase
VQSILIDDPCILFALHRESGPFRSEFRPHQSFPGAPCWARFCGPAWLTVLVVETGMGQANVARAMDWLLDQPKLDNVLYQPKLILFAGFAGALTEDLHIGDIVLADEIVDLHGHRWRTTWPNPLPDGSWIPPLHQGRLLTVDHLITSPQEKYRLGQEHQAQAVEMESALFASRCTQAGIPFGCVRAISDEVTTPLAPALATLLSGGTVSPWRLLSELARHPGLIFHLLRLARDTKRAAQQLGLALGELLTLTLGNES